MSNEEMQDKKRHWFTADDRRAGNIPQPEQFPLRAEPQTDMRTSLCDVRMRVWRINHTLPDEMGVIAPDVRAALDALNMALSKLVVKDMSETWESKNG